MIMYKNAIGQFFNIFCKFITFTISILLPICQKKQSNMGSHCFIAEKNEKNLKIDEHFLVFVKFALLQLM